MKNVRSLAAHQKELQGPPENHGQPVEKHCTRGLGIFARSIFRHIIISFVVITQ
jgi:hypothetical protein